MKTSLCISSAVLLLISAAVWIALKTIAADQTPAEENELRVGFIATFSGPRASLGSDAVRGAALALDEIRARGASRQIRLLIEDSRGEPAEGMAAYRKLVQQRVALVLTQNSNVSLPVAQAVNNDHVVQLAFNTTSDAYSKAGDLTFRLNGSTKAEARLQAEVLRNAACRAEELAVLVMEDEYPLTLFNNLMSELKERRMAPAFTNTFLPGETDLRAVVSRLKDQKMNCIVLLAYQTEAGFFARQRLELGFTPRLVLLNTPVNNREFFETAGEAAEGVFITYLAIDRRHPAAAAYRAKYGAEPNWFSANGYDAVMLAQKIMTSCPMPVSAECLKRRLFGISGYTGLSGEKSMDPQFGDMEDKYEVLVVRGGKAVPAH